MDSIIKSPLCQISQTESLKNTQNKLPKLKEILQVWKNVNFYWIQISKSMSQSSPKNDG